MNKVNKLDGGKVWLVGVGLGDFDLFIVKVVCLIVQVDVLVYDYLVGEGIIELVCFDVWCIYVGKEVLKYILLQDLINFLLVDFVCEGLFVVCLKGGDLFIFGCGGEELEILVVFGIFFEVVFGVMVVVGCVVYLGFLLIYCDYV